MNATAQDARKTLEPVASWLPGNGWTPPVFTPAVGLIAHLGPLLGELRKEHKLNRVRVGYHLTQRGKSESALGQFERGQSQPRDLDSVVEAYAGELGMDPLAIWRMALARFEAEGPAGVEREIKAAAQAPRRSSRSSGSGAAAKKAARRGSGGRSRS